ncbi:hypothetical protein Ocin01_07882 [Orchesella cincta]|uniref:Regulatory protein zeste n=1 Tax=Orchesella cincta TaxID=48709 RepID=A0A1D2N0P1_ORCCI|nr:hypothetical protein Ocin01_07882 [Orchesella cincta]
MAMASGEQLKNAKIAVLDLINENKEVLFGKLSDTLTREAKESKWAEIAEHAHALGAFPWHRTWDYLRDTTWQNWRKRFVEKREKKDKHDSTGQGPRIVYDEADLLIMEILESLGKNGPSSSHNNHTNQSAINNSSTVSNPNGAHINDINEVLEIEFDIKNETGNLDGERADEHLLSMNGGDDLNGDNYDDEDMVDGPQQDAYEEDEHTGYQNSNYVNTTTDENSQQPKIISTSSLSRASILRKSAFAAVRSNRKRPASFIVTNTLESSEKELTALKCRKIRAELELLQKDSYKKDLEILQLERSLGLPASDVTRKFYRFPRGNSSIVNNLSNR